MYVRGKDFELNALISLMLRFGKTRFHQPSPYALTSIRGQHSHAKPADVLKTWHFADVHVRPAYDVFPIQGYEIRASPRDLSDHVGPRVGQGRGLKKRQVFSFARNLVQALTISRDVTDLHWLYVDVQVQCCGYFFVAEGS